MQQDSTLLIIQVLALLQAMTSLLTAVVILVAAIVYGRKL